ncbi:MAG: chromosome partitioning protein ParB [Nitrospinae bacterium RIFCSPLOWO2_12_FULL_47_7]|nr:MAG: chromosome partitioning protein ParB [Nitrospinae bacterium RIFCSPLOWO2_12_FULL_47_7]
MKRKALGKGINALIPDFEMGVPETLTPTQGSMELLIDEIVPNRQQPRKNFDDEKLEELVQSIRENGILQPIVVQRSELGYELIVGERRWRASKAAGLKKIPAIIREVSSSESLALAIIENIHRQDLNPIEEASAYQRLAADLGMTQEAIARKVAKNRATIANFLRLLKLPKTIQEDLTSGRLSMGHARALLGLESEKGLELLRREILQKNLNVRQTENRVKNFNNKELVRRGDATAGKKDIFLKNLETELGRALGTKVEVHRGKKGGKLLIAYYSDEDLDRIRDIIVPKFG